MGRGIRDAGGEEGGEGRGVGGGSGGVDLHGVGVGGGGLKGDDVREGLDEFGLGDVADAGVFEGELDGGLQNHEQSEEQMKVKILTQSFRFLSTVNNADPSTIPALTAPASMRCFTISGE